MATVDMFLFKFQNHPLSSLRVCTLPTRLRGCTRVRDLSYLNKKLLEKLFKESIQYIFLRSVGKELKQILEKDQEMGEENSYFNYQSSIGIVTKSAHTSGANPFLYNLVHIIRAVKGYPQSVHSRHTPVGGQKV